MTKLWPNNAPKIFYDKHGVKMSGNSCHFCHNGFTEAGGSLWFCTFTKPHSRGRQCRKKFCLACLTRKFPSWIKPEERAAGEWKCPSCCDSCDCATCRTCIHGALRKRCTYDGCDHHPDFVGNYRSSRPKQHNAIRREAQALPYNRGMARPRSRGVNGACNCGQPGCTAGMTSPCPSCGIPGPVSSKFCSECGFKKATLVHDGQLVVKPEHSNGHMICGGYTHGPSMVPVMPQPRGGAFTFPVSHPSVSGPPVCRTPTCSFRSTGKQFVLQAVFTCGQCSMEARREVCCQDCAMTCHAGHAGVRFLQEGKAYCDCGAASASSTTPYRAPAAPSIVGVQTTVVSPATIPSIARSKVKPEPKAVEVSAAPVARGAEANPYGNDIEEAAAAMLGLCSTSKEAPEKESQPVKKEDVPHATQGEKADPVKVKKLNGNCENGENRASFHPNIDRFRPEQQDTKFISSQHRFWVEYKVLINLGGSNWQRVEMLLKTFNPRSRASELENMRFFISCFHKVA
eukprot:g33910.t1